ncbi:YchJ family protein [Janibacter sp. G56]|uniref:YchJ family protein n=1 Tax=Janibacter sp. G56 TaxID=3418717 RepID=UPI003D02E892
MSPAAGGATFGGGRRAARGDAPCPCGVGATFVMHCGPLVAGEELAPTALDLMRSRYTAHVLATHGDPAAEPHLVRTWHPRTRPEDVLPQPGLTWTGLRIIDVTDGGIDDATDEVEFVAAWRSGSGAVAQTGRMHERSRFARRAGRWLYVDGDHRD